MTATNVAVWMLEELKRVQYLYQEVVVCEIQTTFGEEFVYINDNGNLAISRPVLNEFRRLTEKSVVWERGERMWRFREGYDAPGERQAE
jgi:hypothetical protein